MISNVNFTIKINQRLNFKIAKMLPTSLMAFYQNILADYLVVKNNQITSFYGLRKTDGYNWLTLANYAPVALNYEISTNDNLILLCIKTSLLTKYISYFEELLKADNPVINEDLSSLLIIIEAVTKSLPPKEKKVLKPVVDKIIKKVAVIKPKPIIKPKEKGQKKATLTLKTLIKEAKVAIPAKPKTKKRVKKQVVKKAPVKPLEKKALTKPKVKPKPVAIVPPPKVKKAVQVSKPKVKKAEVPKIIKPISEKKVQKQLEPTPKPVVMPPTPKIIPKKTEVKIEQPPKPILPKPKLEKKALEPPLPPKPEPQVKTVPAIPPVLPKADKDKLPAPVKIADIQPKTQELPAKQPTEITKPSIVIIEKIEAGKNKIIILQDEAPKPEKAEANNINLKTDPGDSSTSIIPTPVESLQQDNLKSDDTLPLNQVVNNQPGLDNEEKIIPEEPVLPQTIETEPTVTYIVIGPDGNILYNEQILIAGNPRSVEDIILSSGLPVDNNKGYIDGIAGIAGNEATKSGWMYEVDGADPRVGASQKLLTGGETVLWKYVQFDQINDENKAKNDSPLLKFADDETVAPKAKGR